MGDGFTRLPALSWAASALSPVLRIDFDSGVCKLYDRAWWNLLAWRFGG